MHQKSPSSCKVRVIFTLWNTIWCCSQPLAIFGSNADLNPKTGKMSQVWSNPEFWARFSNEVLDKKSWKCSFPEDVLWAKFDKDVKLYENQSILKYRRDAIQRWLGNDTDWAHTIVSACKELATGNTEGIFTQELKKYHLLAALEDFVNHLHYFYEVAELMEVRGEKVKVLSPMNSTIHDIDKLDPVMLAAYSERYEDNRSTTLWDICVQRHTLSQPHHQAHCIWHDCCSIRDEQQCLESGNAALREMVCDKVSRRLQKNLDGKQSIEMWDAGIEFYAGLPQTWLNRAIDLMKDLKKWKGSGELMETLYNPKLCTYQP